MQTQNNVAIDARFEFESKLADALQGRIYLGFDNVTQRKCVIKEAWKSLVSIRRTRTSRRQATDEDFKHEVQTVMEFTNASDSHPNIISGLVTWEDRNCYFLAMEYCDTPLFEFIANSAELAANVRKCMQIPRVNQACLASDSTWITTVKDIFRQIVSGVAWMTKRGYCHSDLSLENTMLIRDNDDDDEGQDNDNDNNNNKKPRNTAKIIDLGLCKKFEKNNFQTCRRVGKSQYMSPEAYLGRRYDARANDIFCLGVMLFMMLMQAPPFQKADATSPEFPFFMQHKIDEYLRFRKRLGLVTEEALDLLTKMLRYENDGRITIEELLQHPFLAGSDSESVTDAEAETAVSGENVVIVQSECESESDCKEHEFDSGISDENMINNNNNESNMHDNKHMNSEPMKCGRFLVTGEVAENLEIVCGDDDQEIDPIYDYCDSEEEEESMKMMDVDGQSLENEKK
jgi:serine/threonine protein kinase